MTAMDVCNFIYCTMKQDRAPVGSLPCVGFCAWWLRIGLQLPRNA